jgi:hypothetical protein
MKKTFLKFVTAAIACLINYSISIGQQKIAEFSSGDFEISDFSSAVSNDSLFVDIQYRSGPPSENSLQYWIDVKNNVATPVLHKPIAAKALCGITLHGDTIDYYFYSENKKSVVLNLYRTHTKSGYTELLSTNLRTDIKFLGSYVDKNLVLLFSSPETFSIRLIEMNGLTPSNEKAFQVPNDLLVGREKFLFMPEGTRPRMNQGQALKKIYKQGSELIITADQPYEDFNEKRTVYKTTLARLNLATGKATVKFFTEDRKIPFHTAVFGKYLFRMFDTNLLDIHDLEKGTKEGSFEFHPKNAFIGIPQFVRDGKKVVISRRSDRDKLFFSKSTAFVNVDSIGSSLVLIIGRSGERGSAFFAGGFVGMLASVAITAIRDSMEPKNIIAYSYLTGNLKENFSWSDKFKSIDHRIDEYEISRFAGVKLKLKAYAEDRNNIFGFYQRSETKAIEVIKFEKR